MLSWQCITLTGAKTLTWRTSPTTPGAGGVCTVHSGCLGTAAIVGQTFINVNAFVTVSGVTCDQKKNWSCSRPYLFFFIYYLLLEMNLRFFSLYYRRINSVENALWVTEMGADSEKKVDREEWGSHINDKSKDGFLHWGRIPK